MIVAVADYAEAPAEHSLPPILRTAFAVQRFDKLPRAGGLDDQPAGLMRRITYALNIYDAFRAFWHSGMTWADFANQRPEQYRVVNDVRKLREQYGQYD